MGVIVARANRPGPLGLTSSNVVTSTGGVFTRLHGAEAPSFVLVDLERPTKSVSLAKLRGRPLVLNFWASWCAPCREEMPALEGVARQLRGMVEFVGLDTQDQSDAALAFARAMRVTYPLAIATAQVWSAYGVFGLPTTFFISPDGHLVGKQVGALTRGRLRTLIHQLFGVSAT
ncbi:MAG: TlpA family protein disulfide reductase [Hyphomicrobiales bacterium]